MSASGLFSHFVFLVVVNVPPSVPGALGSTIDPTTRYGMRLSTTSGTTVPHGVKQYGVFPAFHTEEIRSACIVALSIIAMGMVA